MKINLMTKDEKFPFIMIDDFFDEEEESLVWKELEFYQDKAITETEIIATYKNRPLGTTKRLYLDAIYSKPFRHISDILRIVPGTKLWSEEVIAAYKKTNPQHLTFLSSNHDSTQLSYYENNDYYNPHFDVAQHTALIWMYKEPKKFSGGDLLFPASKQMVECVTNRMILFPSYYMHGVTKLEMNKSDMGKGYGRWSITNFSCHVGTERNPK